MIKLHEGNCLEVMAKLAPESVDLILCDLPYGTTPCLWDVLIPFEALWKQYRRVAKRNAAIVLTSDQPFTTTMIASNYSEFRYCWTWKKPYATGFMNANKMPLKNTEDVCVFYRKLPTYNPQGIVEVNKSKITKRANSTSVYNNMALKEGAAFTQRFTNYPRQVIEFAREKGKTIHPTQKPVALMEYMIRTYTNEGDTVLDNCMGSGSTGVACKNLNRSFIGIELDPQHFETAKKRIEDWQSCQED